MGSWLAAHHPRGLVDFRWPEFGIYSAYAPWEALGRQAGWQLREPCVPEVLVCWIICGKIDDSGGIWRMEPLAVVEVLHGVGLATRPSWARLRCAEEQQRTVVTDWA